MKNQNVLVMLLVSLILVVLIGPVSAQEVIGEAPKVPSEVVDVCIESVEDETLGSLIERSKRGEILLHFTCSQSTNSLVEPDIPNETAIICIHGDQGSVTIDQFIARAEEGEFLISFACVDTKDVDLEHFGAVDVNHSVLWDIRVREGLPVPAENGKWSFTGLHRPNTTTTNTMIVCNRGQGYSTIADLYAGQEAGGYRVVPSCEFDFDQILLTHLCGWVGNPIVYMWEMGSDDWPVTNEDYSCSYAGWLETQHVFLPITIGS